MKDLKDNNESIDIIDDPYLGIKTCHKPNKILTCDQLEKILNR